MKDNDQQFLRQAIELAREHSKDGLNGPFGAVIVKNGKLIAEGWNQVVSGNDPTAHAEINAIRKACQQLAQFSLEGCTLYSSCEPCPMCLSAIVWARIERVVFAETRQGAAKVGFDDEKLYHGLQEKQMHQLLQLEQIPLAEAEAVFKAWSLNANKVDY